MNYKELAKMWAWRAAIVVIVIIILSAISGCSPKVVTIPEAHYEYITKHDSVILRDTISKQEKVIIRELDSVQMAQYGIELEDAKKAYPQKLSSSTDTMQQIQQMQQIRTDTIIRHDSISVPVYIEKGGEKVSLLRHIRMIGCLIIMLGVILFLIRLRR